MTHLNFVKSSSVLLLVVAFTSTLIAKPVLPYRASPEREKQIVDGATKIVVGMAPAQLEAILGKPDNVTPLYEPKISKPNQIGNTNWYIIQQFKEHGSVVEVGRIAIAVRTDMKGNVTRVDSFKLP